MKKVSATKPVMGEFTSAGERMRPVYTKVTEDGVPRLRQIGEENIKAQINSCAPPNIQQILNRASHGDMSLLKARSGAVYADVSGIHEYTDLVELKEKVDDLAKKAMQQAAISAAGAKNMNNADGGNANE